MSDEQEKPENTPPILDNADDIVDSEENKGEEKGQDALVLASDVLPPTLPIILLRPRPAFPGTLVPMVLSGKPQLAMAQRASESSTKTIGFVLAKDPEEPDSEENMYRIGVVGRIMKVLHTDENSIHLLMNCLERLNGAGVFSGQPADVRRIDAGQARCGDGCRQVK